MDIMTQESHAETQKDTVLPLNCKITLLSPPSVYIAPYSPGHEPSPWEELRDMKVLGKEKD